MSESNGRSPRVLYITYWGAAEPLGQSLVLPAVRRLSELGARMTLVSFEKPADLAAQREMARIQSFLDQYGVRWIPLRYHKRPKVPATAFDILHGWARGLVTQLESPCDLIHARTYIAGLIGMILAPVLRVKWIYHNEGFYPDEQVDGGVWRVNSLVYRVARSLEQRMYASANGLIGLSYRAKSVLDNLSAVRRKATPTIVVPSCVELEHFRLDPAKRPPRRDELHLVYIGSIGLRYVFDRVAAFVAAACRELGRVRLRILTRADPAEVGALLRQNQVPAEVWSIQAVAHANMPEELVDQDAGLSFLTQGLSEHGGSPTKVGEYWASGLPVVTTPNTSDTDDIIRSLKVGVIVREHSETEYRRAARELRVLLDDPDLPRRCRLAAETHYSLAIACDRQMALYRALLLPRGEGGT